MREHFIWTYTNQKFYPLDPREDEVRIEDIAHALSQICRANGHFKRFYSVAQHSINCAAEARARGLDNRLQLACLLHDASEAYIADLNRPVKQCMKEYVAVESKLQSVIFSTFQLTSLTDEEWTMVTEIDDALLHYEFEHLHGELLSKEPQSVFSSPDLKEKNVSHVEAEFINAFQRLKEGVQKSIDIDACESGWAAFWVDSSGGYGFERCRTIDDIFPKHDDADSILIDIPIGLPESSSDVRPDGELRRRLKGKEPCVFETPCRDAVNSASKTDARKKNIRILSKSLSAQSIGFSRKIKEVDEFLLSHPSYIDRIRESHPEYAFCVLNHDEPILSKKRDAAGREDRLTVLQRHFDQARKALEGIHERGFPESIDNDILDAMVLAVMGLYGIEQGFETIPAEPPRDSRGLRMEIVYCRPKGKTIQGTE